ncbi:MAG: protein arginine kinase [Planctomycetota bacterium]|nr:protein arginine kinase [Planctomycetota bacterium]
MRLERRGPWIESGGADADVVISSRVRLARNLAGFNFVNQSTDEESRELVRLVRSFDFSDSPGQWIDVDELAEPQRQLLVERHLVSRPFLESSTPRSVLIGQDERLSVMVNEEDHLRVQVILPGCGLESAWERATVIDERLERDVEFAVHPRWGYLTACPTNLGTAIRFSIMAHLPALRMTNELERLRRAANALDLAVRGFYGEGSESSGDFYQVSNQITLGVSESDLLGRFVGSVVPRIVEYERMARNMLLDRSRPQLEDRVHRSLGLLRSARLLGVDEAMKHLSRVRLGVALDLLDGVALEAVQRLFLEVQPGHLTLDDRFPGESVPADELDETMKSVRATLVRTALSN